MKTVKKKRATRVLTSGRVNVKTVETYVYITFNSKVIPPCFPDGEYGGTVYSVRYCRDWQSFTWRMIPSKNADKAIQWLKLSLGVKECKVFEWTGYSKHYIGTF